MGYGINGTPWVIIDITKDPRDERRHKTRCKYFKHLCKKEGYCSVQHFKCIGSARCDFYEEQQHDILIKSSQPKDNTFRHPKQIKINIDSISIEKMLIGAYMISPTYNTGKIVAVKGSIMHIQMLNTPNNEIKKVGFSALTNHKIGRWQAADEDIQNFILQLIDLQKSKGEI